MEYIDDYLGAITQTVVRRVSEVEKGYTSLSFDNKFCTFKELKTTKYSSHSGISSICRLTQMA
jgi:hypothetical protein